MGFDAPSEKARAMAVKLPESVTLCLGVGAQKAGTTWLATYFAKHPAVFMSPIKELHYFDAVWLPERMGKRNQQHLAKFKRLAGNTAFEDVASRSPKWVEAGLHYDRLEMVAGGHEKYLEFFAKRVGDLPVAAEISPSYSLLSAENFKAIRGLHGRVKAVFLMRNPIDRVWSALRHLERRNDKVASRFEKAIAHPGMMLRSDYGRTLDALSAGFPDGDVFVEFYENLFSEPTIRRLCDFLSIPYHPAPFGTVVNKAKERAMSPDQRQRVGALLRPVYDNCHKRFGERLPENWVAEMKYLYQDS